MAGEWIPISVDLPHKPEVAQIAEIMRRSTDEVVGILVRFWIWVQAHTTDGTFPGCTPETLAKSARVPASFIRALITVGWLIITETGVTIPHFERWFKNGAKRRLRAAGVRPSERTAEVCARKEETSIDLSKVATAHYLKVGRKWPKGLPHSESDSQLLWRVCYLAAQKTHWALAVLDGLQVAKPQNPGAYLQTLVLNLGPDNPPAMTILASIPTPENLPRYIPKPQQRPATPQAERPLSEEERKRLTAELMATIGR